MVYIIRVKNNHLPVIITIVFQLVHYAFKTHTVYIIHSMRYNYYYKNPTVIHHLLTLYIVFCFFRIKTYRNTLRVDPYGLNESNYNNIYIFIHILYYYNYGYQVVSLCRTRARMFRYAYCLFNFMKM